MNLAGEAFCNADILLAQTAPGFAHKLDRQRDVDEGEPLELKAKLDGSPIPTAKWYVAFYSKRRTCIMEAERLCNERVLKNEKVFRSNRAKDN